MSYKKERTLILIKPDGVKRKLVGEIVSRFEKVGLKIIAIKMLVPTKALAQGHYPSTPDWYRSVGEKSLDVFREKGIKDPYKIGKIIKKRLSSFISSGSVVVMVPEGSQAVDIARKIVGSTEPLKSDVGTIRGDFTVDSYKLADQENRAVQNLVHASSSQKEAKREINVWFNKKELVK